MSPAYRRWRVLLWLVVAMAACNDHKVPSVNNHSNVSDLAPFSLADALNFHYPPYEPSDEPPLGTLGLVSQAGALSLARSWARTLNGLQTVVTLDPRQESDSDWWQDASIGAALHGGAMGAREKRAFERKWGYPPLELKVAMDPVVIAVHKENPILRRGLGLPLVRRIFAPGDQLPARRWGDLGLSGPWLTRRLRVYAPDSGDPLLVWAISHFLNGIALNPIVHRLPNAAAVVDAVRHDPAAIGLVNGSNLGNGVEAVPLGKADAGPFTPPEPEALLLGRYPLPPRFIYLCLNHRPGIALDAPSRELVRFIFSREGQQAAADSGLIPLPASLAASELEDHGLSLSPEGVLLTGAPSFKAPSVAATAGESRSSAP